MEALSTFRDTAQHEPSSIFPVDAGLINRQILPSPKPVHWVADAKPFLPRFTEATCSHSPLIGQHSVTGRVFDVAISLLAILIFLPFLVLTTLAIKLSAPGPVLFVQSRIGRDGKPFPCLKFRTMVVNSQDVLTELLAQSPDARAEWERDQKLRNDPRITGIGSILRKSSLDELPQLFNILAGHMSVVGPRPIIETEIIRYGSRFAAYCSVRPGLTGLWQVSGRNEIAYDTRIRLDARYALRKSTLYDIGICLRTVPAVLASRGVY
ncbi:sugar transferase [Novosphingobium kaempferiae]|uniref:sugar transferase n=1 Tax=Novosphingobium kaempferiae TaxID=2896849 RepID=UPI001E54EA41|nr:sugar transferase [Novosphingobium kaempferiae]